jgi:hypothetical protein
VKERRKARRKAGIADRYRAEREQDKRVRS